MSAQGLYYLVGRVGARAGINAHIHPHLLRHAYGDHIAKNAGLLVAQAVLGHASVETTRSTYVDRVSLDQLADATRNVTYQPLSPPEEASLPCKAPTGIEPVESNFRSVSTDRSDLGRLLVQLREAFTGITFDEAAA